MGGQSFQFFVRLLRFCEGDQLDFVELMQANEAPRVFTVRAGLTPEARRIGGVANGQRLLRQHFLSMQVCHGYFCGGDQEEFLIAYLKQVFLEFRQLPGPRHGRAIDEEGRQHLTISVLAGMPIEHVVDERAFESRPQARQHGKAGFRHTHGTIEVQNSKRLSEIPVRLGRSGECGGPAPSTHFYILVGILPGRHGLVREVGDAQCDVEELFFDEPELLVLPSDGVTERFHRGHGRFSRLFVTFQSRDLVGPLFQLMPKIFHLDRSGATIFGQCSEVLPGDIFAARSEPLSKSVQIVSQDAKVVHTRFPVKRREI